MKTTDRQLIIVTGLSGSGKTIALNALEDIGFYCIDNLPVSMLEALGTEINDEKFQATYAKTAVGMDARDHHHDFSQIPKKIKRLADNHINCTILYLDASNDILIRRFSETRRLHPLTDNKQTLVDAITQERKLLEPLFRHADLKIDTSNKNIHQLRNSIQQQIGKKQNRLSILIQSFGYKHGIPHNADIVFDIRCLPNPHWQQKLRAFTGKDQEVIDFLEAYDEVNEMQTDILNYVTRWIPAFAQTGRSYLTVAVGCTGGQHRSVFLTENIARQLQKSYPDTILNHRELS